MSKFNNFKIIKQKSPFTCGYASVSMITNFLGNGKTEEEILKDFPRGSGITPKKIIYALKRYLPRYKTSVLNAGDAETLKIINGQIEKGLPVPLLYLAVNDFNKPNLAPHYSVVIGADKEKKKVFVADPYGLERELGERELLKMLAFESDERLPLIVKVFKRIGGLKPNTIFVMEEK